MKRFMITILLIMVLCVSNLTLVASNTNTKEPDPRLELTKEELAFIEEHPVIRVSHEHDYAPVLYVENGEPIGISKEFLDLLANIMGIDMEYVHGYTWDELYSMFLNDEIDLLSNVIKTTEREKTIAFSNPYMQEKLGYIVKKDDPHYLYLDDLDRVTNRTMIVIKSYYVEEMIDQYYPDLETLIVASYDEAIKALLNGEGDMFYLNYASFTSLSDTYPLSDYDFVETYMDEKRDVALARFGVKKENEILINILEKAFDLTTYESKARIAANYGLDVSIFYEASLLTDNELKWLNDNPTIGVFVPNDYMPFSKVYSNGRVDGMVSDFLKEFEERLNVKFVVETGPASFNDIVENDNVNMIGLIANTDSRANKMLFTSPVYSVPIVLFSTDYYAFDYEQLLNNQKIYTRRETAVNDMIYKAFPNADVEAISSTAEALDLLSSNKDTLFIHDLISTNYVISNKNYSDIKVVGYTEFSYNLSFGVNKDNAILKDILDKTLNQLYADKGNELQQKWLTSTPPTDYTTLVIIIIIAVFLITFFYLKLRMTQSRSLEREQFIHLINNQVLFITLDQAFNFKSMSDALLYKIKSVTTDSLDNTYREFVDNVIKNINESDLIEESTHDLASTSNLENDDVNLLYLNFMDIYFSYKLYVDKNNPLGHIVVFQDITSHKKLEQLSVEDELTKLYNRRYFNETFMSKLNTAQRHDRYFALLMLDIDNFKKYNDTYLHSQGDIALTLIGTTLKEELKRSDDLSYRLGGEEFACIITTKSVSEAVDYAEHIRIAVENLNLEHTGNLPYGILTVSIGMRVIPPNLRTTQDNIYKQADSALYTAKTSGKNRVKVYDHTFKGSNF